MATRNLNLGPRVYGARPYGIGAISLIALPVLSLRSASSVSLVGLDEYIATPDPYIAF